MSTIAVTTIESNAANTTLSLGPSGGFGGSMKFEGTNNDISITGAPKVTGNTTFNGNDTTFNGNVSLFGSSVSGISELTDNTSIVIDMTSNNNFSITLGGSNTFINPTNINPGQSGVIWITQDATGSRAPSWGSYWKFPANTAPTLSTAANSVDAICYSVRTATSITAQAILNVG